ncbi:hypothetical protein AN958_08956 [Leucoagaricus sp. SymC.cos]|nr:hypothetical protein AN958_08956 [Leucoagaricus sp. SymC.cos]
MGTLPQQPQSPYTGQQQLPSGMQFQQTTTRTTTMGQPQMTPMQPQLTGQPSMMGMNQMSMGVGMQQQPLQPMQPQSTGVMMNMMVPGATDLDLCAQGNHARTRKYGPCGLITAIVLFPIGLLALLVDVEEYCVRCGTRF